MLYNVLVGFVFSQLHYTTKKAASFIFLDAAFSFVFYSAILFITAEFAGRRSSVLSEDTAEIVGVVEAATHCNFRNGKPAVAKQSPGVTYADIYQVALRGHSIGGGEQPYKVPLRIMRALYHV